MKAPSTKGRFFLLIFIAFLAQACLDPSEKEGRCTKCQSIENLQNGFCYTKIRGCLKQTNTTCVSCQDGYVKDGNTCTRYAEYFNITSLAPSTVKLQESKLSASDISSVVGGFQQTTNFNSSIYVQAKDTLLKQYPVLAALKIYKVEQQIVNGVNYIFYIINTQNYDLYLAKVYVTLKLEGTVAEIYKNDASISKSSVPIQGPQPLPGVWKQLSSFNDSRYNEALDLIKNTYSGIDKYVLLKTEYQIVAGLNFLFYYNGPNSQKFTIQIYKPFYGPAIVKNQWGTRPVAQNSVNQTQSPLAGGVEVMPASDYEKEPFLSVIKVIQKSFPKFTIAQVKKVQRQIVAGWNLIVTFSQVNSTDVYDVLVFVPLSYTGKPPEIQQIKKNGVAYTLPISTNNQTTISTTTTSTATTIVGGYSDVTNVNSSFYLQAKADLIKQYPELSSVVLTKSQEQIVNGVNYIFQFINQKTGDKYSAQVYVSFTLKTTINTIFKNDKSIKIGESTPQAEVTPKVGAWQEFTDLTDERLVASKAFLTAKYPTLSNYKLTRVESQIVSGINFRFFFEKKNTNETVIVQVYYPFSKKAQITNVWGNINDGSQTITTDISSSPQSGKRQVISDAEFNDEPYLSAKLAILQVFPKFDDSLVISAQKQIVSGWNVYIKFTASDSTDVYEIVVFVPLPETGEVPQVTSIIKNGEAYEPQNQVLTTSTVSQTNRSNILTGGYSSNVNQSNPYFIEAKSTLFKQYPFLQGFNIKKVENQIVSGMNYIFTIVDLKSNDQFIARVYVNLNKQASVEEISKNGVNIKKNTSLADSRPVSTPSTNSLGSYIDDLVAGGWESVSSSEFSTEPFASVQKEILRNFPTFTTTLVKKAVKQIVAGWNYAISFTLPNSNDLYEVKVYVPLSYTGKGPSISQVKKNGVAFTLSPSKIETSYNYQTDPKFAELYNFFKNQVKITNLLPIAEVSRSLRSLPDSGIQYYQYNITYSSDEFAICRWYLDFNVFEVVSFIADKTQIYRLASKLSSLPLLRTQGVLTQKIKEYDQKKFNRALIKDIVQIKLSEYVRIFRLNAYCFSGHYNVTILDNGQLFVIQVQLVDNQKGFVVKTNAIVQYRQEYVIEQLRIFLFSRYSLSGYVLSFAVVNALDSNTNQYVILLARDDLKKIKVSVEESTGTFTIRKLQVLNNGLYIVTDAATQKSIDIAAKKQFSSGLNGFDRAVFFSNGTLNVGVYSNDTSMSTYFNNTILKVSDLKNKAFSKSSSCQSIQQAMKPCTKCLQSDILWRGKCYVKIQNCAFQVGSECLSCDKQSLEVKGTCVKDYTLDLFI